MSILLQQLFLLHFKMEKRLYVGISLDFILFERPALLQKLLRLSWLESLVAVAILDVQLPLQRVQVVLGVHAGKAPDDRRVR